MRLDIWLVNNGFFKSREKAKQALADSKVLVNNKICKKPAQVVCETDEVKVDNEELIYVSRAGYKLRSVLDTFEVKVAGRDCLDVGSSTGGFTQCLLEDNARRVVAVDVGTAQMEAGLAADQRVDLYENTDIRNFTLPEDVKIDVVVADVSFISLTKIVPYILKLKLSHPVEFLLLFKPQFEVGKENVSRGLYRGKKIETFLQSFNDFLIEQGLSVPMILKVPLLGKKGNQEYFFYSKSGTIMK